MTLYNINEETNFNYLLVTISSLLVFLWSIRDFEVEVTRSTDFQFKYKRLFLFNTI